jgi:nucleoside-diphosphate-sugar epimerase
MKTCCITGTRGFFGGCLARYFSKIGWRIIELNRLGKIYADGAEAVAYSLGDKFPERLAQVDVLIHAAYDLKAVKWDEIYKLNVLGTEELFDSAKQSGVSQCVYVSSIAAFDGCISLYGKAKLLSEKTTLKYNGFALRPGLIYDDKESGGMLNKLERLVSTIPILPLPDGGNSLTFLSHQEDLCRLVEYQVSMGESRVAIITGANSRAWKFRDLLQTLADRKNKSVLFIPIPSCLCLALLKACEALNLPMPFKSDSLISLLNNNPTPNFIDGSAAKFRVFQ